MVGGYDRGRALSKFEACPYIHIDDDRSNFSDLPFIKQFCRSLMCGRKSRLVENSERLTIGKGCTFRRACPSSEHLAQIAA